MSATYVLSHRAKHLVLSRLGSEWRSVYAVLPEVHQQQGGGLRMSLSLLLRHLKALEKMGYAEGDRGRWRLTRDGAVLLRGLGPWQQQATPITAHGEAVRRSYAERTL